MYEFVLLRYGSCWIQKFITSKYVTCPYVDVYARYRFKSLIAWLEFFWPWMNEIMQCTRLFSSRSLVLRRLICGLIGSFVGAIVMHCAHESYSHRSTTSLVRLGRFRRGLPKTWRDSENGQSACLVCHRRDRQTTAKTWRERRDSENGQSASPVCLWDCDRPRQTVPSAVCLWWLVDDC